MIKNKLKDGWLYGKLRFVRKVGLGKLIINFTFQRVFRINSQIRASTHFTSTFIGDSLLYDVHDLNILVSFASSNALYIQSINGIELGARVLIASGVKIISANHTSDLDRTVKVCPPIKIGNDVWIGTGAIILPGVTIASGSIVAAGAVVTKSFLQPGSVIGGNPAKLIKVNDV